MNQLGVIGLGTMGANLARNAARNGAKVVVYNRTKSKTDAFMKQFASEGDIVAVTSYKDFIEALTPPRPILVMVKAGDAVDAVINDLHSLLEADDIIIDGGNSHYRDTDRRYTALKEHNIGFIGLGISGGEEGALHGPSLMPGADPEVYTSVAPLLETMAADDGAGGKCVELLGPGGAGHFVKMVHNGIEYALMQLIAESYDVLKTIGGYSNEELADTFRYWNEGDDLQSFLVEITAKILEQKDDQSNAHLVDTIVDRAAQKGTGKWTSIAAFDYGVSLPTIHAAVDARILSGSTQLRSWHKNVALRADLEEPMPGPEKLRTIVRSSLHLSSILAYAQGFELIRIASEEEGWNIDRSACARLWKGGCIIRSVLLQTFVDAYSSNTDQSESAQNTIRTLFGGDRQVHWRLLQELTSSRGIAIPATAASLGYYDALRRETLPQNLIQAQRDFFGAHTFERYDKEGSFHVDWV